MKKLILLFAVLISSSAIAGNYNCNLYEDTHGNELYHYETIRFRNVSFTEAQISCKLIAEQEDAHSYRLVSL